MSNTWPWAPATNTQGFLSSRWLRRDGAIYPTEPLSPPEVLSATWTLDMPTVVGAIIGPCGFVGSVTNWAITEGNADGYWAISSTGLLTVASVGMFDGVIYEISVVASNGSGASAPTPMYIRTVAGGRTGLYALREPTPIAGGPDSAKKVDVPSGQPRAERNPPPTRSDYRGVT